MAGGPFKRCTKCGRRVQERTCERCGSGFKWAFTTYVGKGPDGRWIRQLRSGFPTRQAAEKARTELRATIDAGAYVEPSDVTLAQYLREEWLPATAPPQVKYDTWADRRDTLERYVMPRLGGVALQELNAAHLNRLYTELLRGGRQRRAEGASAGLSPTTVRRVHTMLRKALNDAVRWGRIARNPAPLADPPPMRTVNAARRRAMRTWSQQDLRRFLEATADHPLHTLWLVAASTGLRRSEIAGLRWTDVNLRAHTLIVLQTVTVSEDGYLPEEDQKSDGSARTIHLDARVVAALRSHRAEQAAIRLEVGPAWNDQGLVFPREDGAWWNPNSLTSAFTRAVKAAGLPRIRLHDLRHTHATLLLAAGVNPKVVSERLGHSSVAFTLDTYAHVLPGMQPEAAALFLDLVLGADLSDEPAAAAAAPMREQSS